VRVPTRIHRAWAVAAVTFLVLLAAAAFRSSFGVMLTPLEDEFGWSRAVTSLAVSLNLVVYGVTAPFAAALMTRFGVRRIAAVALVLIGAGTGLTVLMTSAWQLVVLWGVFVGLGTGATALVFGALVTNRWFVRHRGLVMGILGAAWATGQLVFLPLLAHLVESRGWRWASLAIAVMSLLIVPLVLLVIRDRPSQVGLRPYGAPEQVAPDETPEPASGTGWAAATSAVTVLRSAARTRTFWLLAGTFFVCGWTTNGIISTHFVPATHDHGMSATTAASLLAVVGLFDLVGTVGSGWLTDRVDPRLLLCGYYLLRGVALAVTPLVLGPDVVPPVLLVMVLFGLDWVATVPPTATLCREAYGVESGAIVFGWVFASHMIGAAASAVVSGALRAVEGSYTTAWWLAAALALAASGAALLIRRPQSPTAPPAPGAVGAAGLGGVLDG
jgi:sugar phosphate permease